MEPDLFGPPVSSKFPPLTQRQKTGRNFGMALRLFVFDAYATLFDVGSAVRLEAAEPGAKAWSDRWAVLGARRRQFSNCASGNCQVPLRISGRGR